MAKAFGMVTEGLELSPSRVAYAQTNGLKVVTPQEIQPDSYHFINAEQVFEHLADPLAVLKSCFGWLQPKGFLRIAVPDGGKVDQQMKKGVWSISEMPTMPLEHINTFTPASLRYFAHQNGFQVIQPPLVLPAFGLNLAEIRQALGVLAIDAASRLGLYWTTVVWLQKP
jgi:SAM-dependent methyltransferase